MIEITRKLAIIILNWNGLNDTIECILSIQEQLKLDTFKIFLVDNNSSQNIDGIYDYTHILPIEIIKLKDNIGFAAGNNVGLKRALREGFDLFLLLNNDTVFVDDSIYQLIAKMDEIEVIGIGGLVNYYYTDPNKIWQTGFRNNLKTGINKPIKEALSTSPKMIEVDYIPGSSFLIKRKVIETIGVLDWKYFAYFEENDYCVRAKKNGFKVAFLSNSKILHKVGRSSSNKTKIYLRSRNILLFYSKYTTKLFFCNICIIHFLKTVLLILKNKNKVINFRSYLNGIYDFKQGIFYKGSLTKQQNE